MMKHTLLNTTVDGNYKVSRDSNHEYRIFVNYTALHLYINQTRTNRLDFVYRNDNAKTKNIQSNHQCLYR